MEELFFVADKLDRQLQQTGKYLVKPKMGVSQDYIQVSAWCQIGTHPFDSYEEAFAAGRAFDAWFRAGSRDAGWSHAPPYGLNRGWKLKHLKR